MTKGCLFIRGVPFSQGGVAKSALILAVREVPVRATFRTLSRIEAEMSGRSGVRGPRDW